MNGITDNVSLEFENVLSYRGKLDQKQMIEIAKEMNDIISANNANKIVSGLSTTYYVDKSGIMDVEIMYPLDRQVEARSPYKLKPIFRIRNAVKIRHEGNPEMIQKSVDELATYLRDKGLTPITPIYNLTIQEPSNANNMDQLIVDLYVGVSENIL